MEKKLIKLKNETREMDLEEVYIQFKNFLFKSCKTWRGRYEFDDLMQVAFIGLNKAYKAYNAEKGALFLTYASCVVNNELLMHHRKNKDNINIVSLNTPFFTPDNRGELLELKDTIRDENVYEDIAITNIQCVELEAAMEKLNPMEKELVRAIAFENQTQMDIGGKLNISQSYISRKYRSALKRLGKIMEAGG